MSLDIWLMRTPTCPHCDKALTDAPEEVFSANITHNVSQMWRDAGVYDALYMSDGRTAVETIPTLANGLVLMKANPRHFRKHDAPNGWGTYDSALPWLAEWLDACRKFPTATIRVSK